MDSSEACSKTDESTKSTRGRSATAVVNLADALSPTCAPFAARWDAAADRRAKLRTPENLKKLMDAQRAHNSARSTAAQARAQRKVAKASTRNPLAGVRRAARTADKAAHHHQLDARSVVKAAKADYPATLTSVAVKAHALHVVPAGIASYALSTTSDWAMWPGAVSAALVVANVTALWLGRRQLSAAPVEDGVSADERRLLERLDPAYWVGHAEDRGLSGTVTAPASVTPGGIVASVRLDGTWTVGKLRAAEESVRALLGARSDLRIEIGQGPRGGWASLTLRTRSAADGDDLKWAPTSRTFGVDTVTGELVTVALGERMLIAGRSGAGKSVASRPLLFDASEGESNSLAIIDLKKVEGRLWDHRARVASEPESVIGLVDEVVAEMTWRLDELPKGKASWTPTAAHPRITLVVDEGAEVMSACSSVEVVVEVTEKGKEVTEKLSALPGLESIARMGRAACIDLWWMTQKPTIGDGIPKQIAPQLSTSICLAVRTPAEARVVLGEDAQAKGWTADELPAPGVALVRDGTRGPHPIQVRYMDDARVIALPPQPIWRRGAAPVAARANVPAVSADAARPGLRLVKDGDFLLAPPQAAPEMAAPAAVDETGLTDNQRAVLGQIRTGETTNASIAKALEMNPGSVKRAVDALVTRGLVEKDGTAIRMGGAA